jgi:hypothetical protein
MHAIVDHVGPASTLAVAYSRLFRATIVAPDRYTWREGPSVAIYRSVHIDGKAGFNHTQLCFAVTKLRQSKKRQGRPKRGR